jgi:WD40 repeat protein
MEFSVFSLFQRRVGRLVLVLWIESLLGLFVYADGAPDAEPLRQLGQSEFRLTCGEENERPFRFSPDGKLLAGASRRELRIWSFPEGKLLHDLSGSVQTRSIGFGSEGRELLALNERDMAIFRFDARSGKSLGVVKLQDAVREEGATEFWFSEDGKWLTSTETYGHVTAWETATGKRSMRVASEFEAIHAPVTEEGVLTLKSGVFIHRFDARTGKSLSKRRMDGMNTIVASTPNGTVLAGYSEAEKAIVFWDTAVNQHVGGKIPTDKESLSYGAPAVSANGKRIIYASKKRDSTWLRQVAVAEVETGKVVSQFDPPDFEGVEEPVISPDGRYAFLVGGRSVFRVFDTESGQPLHSTPDHALAIEGLSFTPDDKTLLVGSRDKQQTWEVATGDAGVVLEQGPYGSVSFAIDDATALVAGVEEGGARLQQIASGKIEREFEPNTHLQFAKLSASVDRRSFTGIDRSPHNRLTIREWRIADGEVVGRRVLLDPNPRRDAMRGAKIPELALGGSRLLRLKQVERPSRKPDGSINWGRMEIQLEDWKNDTITNRFSIPALGRFQFDETPDGAALAAVISTAHIPSAGQPWGSTYLRLWDVTTGRERIKVSSGMENYFSAFTVVAVSPNGRRVATASDESRIEVWDGKTGERLRFFDARNRVTVLAFSHDGKILASGQLDGRVNLWNVGEAAQ